MNLSFSLLTFHVIFHVNDLEISHALIPTSPTPAISLTPAPFNASYVDRIPISFGTNTINPSRPRVNNTR
jgi:hypothetical protein